MNPSEKDPNGPAAKASDGLNDGYEFTPEQNVLFAGLASKMQFVGLFALGVGIVAIVLGALRRDVGILFSGSLYALFGLWTERSSRSFRFVAATQGHDIRHLMRALNDLRRLFTLQYWICLAALVATILLLGVSVVGRVD
jgi:hypothetical protein